MFLFKFLSLTIPYGNFRQKPLRLTRQLTFSADTCIFMQSVCTRNHKIASSVMSGSL